MAKTYGHQGEIVCLKLSGGQFETKYPAQIQKGMVIFMQAENRKPTDIPIEVMLYICSKCGSSFSLPILPEREAPGFLFPSTISGYLFLSFEGEYGQLYDEMQKKLRLYAYPYLNFEGYNTEDFLRYVNDRIWADIADRAPGELISASVNVPHCPHCRSTKMKKIGKLLPHCEGENEFAIYRVSLEHWNDLPAEEQNRQVILLLKGYAQSYREERKEQKEERRRKNPD